MSTMLKGLAARVPEEPATQRELDQPANNVKIEKSDPTAFAFQCVRHRFSNRLCFGGAACRSSINRVRLGRPLLVGPHHPSFTRGALSPYVRVPLGMTPDRN